ncbi:hypothetical protein LT330_005118 [Penicillium expansum]|nr:hypothetical protein LT330_005118 [Penicillium expansum]
MIGFDDNLVRRLVAERTGYSNEERSEWLEDLERDNSGAWLALLIPQLKELRILSLIWPFGSQHVLKMLQKAAIEEEPVFPHLKEAYAAEDNSETTFPSDWMHSFFKFPSMRKVGCCMAEEYKNDDDDDEDNEDSEDTEDTEVEPESDESKFLKRYTLSPRSSNITDIDLKESNAAKGMREWVQACKALKSFRIVLGSEVVPWDGFEPRKIYESLSLQKLTMESIWVENNDGLDMDTDNKWMGSFVDFTALRLIGASLPNLVGFDEHYLPV